MNRVVLIGRLTADPEHRYTPAGTSFAKFRLAVDRPFVNAETKQREADFLDICCWRQTADFTANYLQRGRLVAVEGRIQTRSFEKDGQKRTAVEIVADNVRGLDKPKDGAPAGDAPANDDPFAEEA